MSGMDKARLVQLAAALVAILFVTRPALANYDAGALLSASPEVIQCMEARLSPEAMELVRSGERSEDRATRKKIWKTYQKCSATMPDGSAIPVYDGPLFDAMCQIDETVDAKEAIAGVREAGVSKLAMFARSRKRLRENERLARALARRNSDLIVLGAPKFHQLSGDLSRAYIRATARGIKRRGYSFVGEVLYTHADKKSGKQHASGERYVDPSLPGTAALLEAIAPQDVPLMTHWEPYAPERDFPKFHALYSAWPDQVFLLPHMGFASPETIEEFMSEHANLYLLTSKRERLVRDFSDPQKQAMVGSAMLEQGLLRPEWKELLIKYQDRILFATDPHMSRTWTKYGWAVENQRLVLGQLPREVAEKIAYKNAERVYGVSVEAE